MLDLNDHKTLMNVVVALAIVHVLLSAYVGYALKNGSLSVDSQLVLGFFVVSVVVNLVIAYLANRCKNQCPPKSA